MSKTKEELDALKKQISLLKNKLDELSEDELYEVVGARKEETIKPKPIDFWESWNPNFLDINKGLSDKD